MAEEAVAAAPPGRGRRFPYLVLVVEDEPGLRDLLCRTLRAAGYRTVEAADGGEALDLLDSEREEVDLVITDVVMPGLDGRELGRRLAQSRPTLPVLYVSAYDVNDIFRRGSPTASAPFLQKPFPPETLLNRVEQLLSQPSAR